MHCCVCGKANDGGQAAQAEAEDEASYNAEDDPSYAYGEPNDDGYAEDSSYADDSDEADSRDSGGKCEDTVGWANKFGATCGSYAKDGHCANGGFVTGHSWAQGDSFGKPEVNCCVCGKKPPPKPPPPPASAACTDTPRWSNQYGVTCEGYVRDGHCGGGAVLSGHEWAAGAAFDHPEANCCICAFAYNGVCQDGGHASMGTSCEYGKDCTDCGHRPFLPPPPPRVITRVDHPPPHPPPPPPPPPPPSPPPPSPPPPPPPPSPVPYPPPPSPPPPPPVQLKTHMVLPVEGGAAGLLYKEDTGIEGEASPEISELLQALAPAAAPELSQPSAEDVADLLRRGAAVGGAIVEGGAAVAREAALVVQGVSGLDALHVKLISFVGLFVSLSCCVWYATSICKPARSAKTPGGSCARYQQCTSNTRRPRTRCNGRRGMGSIEDDYFSDDAPYC
ncbi:hypothetical protein AB1Y20_022033 [Prymnesium parvum]|uniref:Cellulase n=1 Tax=Prymnesium parvum TaxID=97485 RepID=A0AB34JGQ6_PRYPA